MSPRQYDVCRVSSPRSGGAVDLAVILQDDGLADLPTRLVAPLIPIDDRYDLDRVTVPVTIDDVRYAIAVHLLATLPLRAIRHKIAEIPALERPLKAAIDRVFFGVRHP